MTRKSTPVLGPAVPLEGESEQQSETLIGQSSRLTEQQRLQQCNEAIGQALAAYGCSLQALPQFTAEGRVIAVMQLVIAKRNDRQRAGPQVSL